MHQNYIKEAHIKQFEEKGFMHIVQVYSQKEIDAINEAFNLIWGDLIQQGKITQLRDRPVESLFPRLHDYHLRNEAILEMALDSRLFSILNKVLGEEVLLLSSNYFFKAPGTKALPFHQDNFSIGVSPGTTYAVYISLDDADKENGCLSFAQGSQNLEIIAPLTPKDSENPFSDYGQEVPVPEEFKIVDMPTSRGDIVIFNGNILHGSHDNTSKHRFRRSMLNFYAAASVERTTMNFNQLYDQNGNRVRRRLNTVPKIIEGQPISSFINGNYYANNGWK